MTQTSSQTSASSLLDEIKIPSGDEIYDALMSKIEPELMRDNLLHLDELYAGESEEDRAVRYQRYADAFVAYKEALREWMTRLQQAMHDYRQALVLAAEDVDQQEKGYALQGLESKISAA